VIDRLKALAKRHWPRLRLRTILFAVLFFTAAMPGIGAISLRVYENTLVRQTEAELVAQGAVLAAAASVAWPGAAAEPAPDPAAPGYYEPEPSKLDLSRTPVLPERPAPGPAARPADPAALAAAAEVERIIQRTTRTTLASVVVLDRHGIVARGQGQGGDLSALPEVQAALKGQSHSVFRVNGDYSPRYRFEWLSRASGIRLHHARPIEAGGQVVGVLLLSRSPRALFRGLYEDRGKIAIGVVVIFAILVLLAGLVSRGVTRPIEALSAASRDLAAGGGKLPQTPQTAAVEIQALYEDFRTMAERIERRSGYLRDFAAAVSHEFKTPLAGISGAVELLQDHFETMSGAERRRFLDNIAADSERLSQLVTRLLDLARADMASPEGGVAADLAEPVRRAADGARTAAFDVTVALPERLPPVTVPAATIESVLSVLLQNACQAGATRAEVGVKVMRSEVILSVTDDGPGVPEPDRERLFEPFFTSRRAEGGTGLGLPIARSLLAASQGRLTLAPSLSGARFEAALPRAERP
jgi:signal transduction histidine kinase